MRVEAADRAAGPSSAPAPGGDAVGASCVTCGEPRTGAFCAACGQRAPRGRLTVRRITTEAVTSVLDVDRGLLHTMIDLTRRPGPMIRDYVAGRTVRYVAPAKYFLLCVTVAQLVAYHLGVFEDVVAGFTEASGTGPAERDSAVEFFSNYFIAFTALGVPFFALGLRWLFRASGMNYAETLVFSLYTFAQQAIVFTLLLPVIDLAYRALASWTALLYLAVTVSHQVWAAAGFFGTGLISATLRSAVALLVSIMLYVATVLAIARAINLA